MGVCMEPEVTLLSSPDWGEYELLDSGNSAKLERFGPYTFIRPEHQAIWNPSLPEEHWSKANAVFKAGEGESGGKWQLFRKTESPWKMGYKGLKFWAKVTSSRHLGVFPEQAAHWDWVGAQIKSSNRSVNVINLFGYTGLATLAAAQAGARVTHVDASKSAVHHARENQALSGMEDRPVRWIVDDALKYVRREIRRGSQYDGIMLDPPKFGRGPKGEVWECFDMLPGLLKDCRSLLSKKPVFVVITAYAIRASALMLYYALEEMMSDLGGTIMAGELVALERSSNRRLSMAIFARWSAH